MPIIKQDDDGNETIERGLEDRNPDGTLRESWRGPEIKAPLSREEVERGRDWYNQQFGVLWKQTNKNPAKDADKSKLPPGGKPIPTDISDRAPSPKTDPRYNIN
jgi:hypothetical protein